MKKQFRDFAVYIRLHDGHNKPRLDWQAMYRLFPDFEFIPTRHFSSYENFGDCYEHKIYDMIVCDKKGNECFMVYREYYDICENLAYVS